MHDPVTIIGGGLAGSEAAWQMAQRGLSVRLYEMRPQRSTEAHVTDQLAELVCSNSMGSTLPDRALGILKNELLRMGSLIIQTAFRHALPAGSALAVGRDGSARHAAELALRQARLKLLIAYSTMAQIGYLFLMFPLAIGAHPWSAIGWNGGVMQADLYNSFGAMHGTIMVFLGIVPLSGGTAPAMRKMMGGPGHEYVPVAGDPDQAVWVRHGGSVPPFPSISYERGGHLVNLHVSGLAHQPDATARARKIEQMNARLLKLPRLP